MKRIKELLIMLAIMLFVPVAVFAEDKYFNVGDAIKEVGPLSHSYFSAGNTLNNEMAVDGILFSAGNNITVDCQSEYGMIAGNTITVNGKILKDLFIAGNQVTINSSAEIGRDIFGAASNLVINSNINGNAFLGGESVTLNCNSIKGDVSVSAGTITLAEGLKIEGTFKYNEDANIANLDKISAVKIEKVAAEDIQTQKSLGDVAKSTLFGIASLIIVAYVLNWLSPKLFKYGEDRISFKEIAKFAGIGLISLICIPVISILLMVTIIGLPLGIIALVCYAILVYLSGAFTAKLIGSLVMGLFKSVKSNVYLDLAIGIVLLRLICLIPTVGSIIGFLSVLYGLGYVVLGIKNKKAAK